MTIDLEMLEDLMRLVLLWWYIQKEEGAPPTEDNFCNLIHTDDSETDKFMHLLVSQIAELLTSDPSFINIKKKLTALRFRWGVTDGKSHSVFETCEKFDLELNYFTNTEMLLLRRIGFIL